MATIEKIKDWADIVDTIADISDRVMTQSAAGQANGESEWQAAITAGVDTVGYITVKKVGGTLEITGSAVGDITGVDISNGLSETIELAADSFGSFLGNAADEFIDWLSGGSEDEANYIYRDDEGTSYVDNQTGETITDNDGIYAKDGQIYEYNSDTGKYEPKDSKIIQPEDGKGQSEDPVPETGSQTGKETGTDDIPTIPGYDSNTPLTGGYTYTDDANGSSIRVSDDGSYAVVNYRDENNNPVTEYYGVDSDGNLSTGPMKTEAELMDYFYENADSTNSGDAPHFAGPGAAETTPPSGDPDSDGQPTTGETDSEDPQTVIYRGSDGHLYTINLDETLQAAANTGLNSMTDLIIEKQDLSEEQKALLQTGMHTVNQNITEMITEENAWGDWAQDLKASGIQIAASYVVGEYMEDHATSKAFNLNNEQLGIEFSDQDASYINGAIDTAVSAAASYSIASVTSEYAIGSAGFDLGAMGEAAGYAVCGYAGMQTGMYLRGDIESEMEAGGAVIGSAVGGVIGAAVGTVLWPAGGGYIGAYVGAAIGSVVVGEIGEELNNLNGGEHPPRAGTLREYNEETGEYEETWSEKKHDGDRKSMRALADTVTEQVKTVIGLSGAEIADGGDMPDIAVGHKNKKLFINGEQGWVSNPEPMMVAAVKQVVNDAPLEGGNEYILTSLENSDAGTFDDLYEDVANDGMRLETEKKVA